jgi:hypothetical protein
MKFSFCVADTVMLLTCLYHFKSVCIVTPRYFVDVSFCSTCWLLERTEHLSGWNDIFAR